MLRHDVATTSATVWTDIPRWRFIARYRAHRAAEQAELAALRVAVNDLVARTVTCESRLDQHATKSVQLVRTLQPVLHGHGVQLLDIGWRIAALRGVSSTHRRAEVDRLYEQAKAEWAAKNVPGAAPQEAAEPSPDSVAAAAIDDLATVPQKARA